jgi:hypothetical protein
MRCPSATSSEPLSSSVVERLGLAYVQGLFGLMASDAVVSRTEGGKTIFEASSCRGPANQQPGLYIGAQLCFAWKLLSFFGLQPSGHVKRCCGLQSWPARFYSAGSCRPCCKQTFKVVTGIRHVGPCSCLQYGLQLQAALLFLLPMPDAASPALPPLTSGVSPFAARCTLLLLLLLLLLPVSHQANEAMARIFTMLSGPESLLHPAVLLRYLAHKAQAYVRSPIKGLCGVLASVLGSPWGRQPPQLGDSGKAAAGGKAAQLSEQQQALKELMRWP